MTDDDDVDFFDEKAQGDPGWVAWRLNVPAQVDRLFTETLPSAPSEWWDDDAGRDRPPTVPPMPDADRCSDAMLDWIGGVYEWFFPNEPAFLAAENRDLAAQFVAYIGECFTQRAGGIWLNVPANGDRLWSFGPSICFDYTADIIDVVELLAMAAEDTDEGGGFDDVTSEIYSYTVDHHRDRGIPHAFDDIADRYLNNK